MYGIFMESWVILKNYGGVGFLLLLYVMSLIYLLVREQNKIIRSMMVYAPILLILGFLFPVSRKLYVAILDEGGTYYRVLWLLPIGVTLAYTGCTIIYRLSERFENTKKWIGYVGALIGVAVIVLAGEYVYNSPHISKAQNAYHLPQEVIDMCDVMVEKEGDIPFTFAIFPGDLVYYVRQYRTDIGLTYGRDMVEPVWGYGELNKAYMAIEGADEIHAEELIEITRSFPDESRAARFIVLRDSKPIDQPLEDLGLDFLGQYGQYKLYEDPVITERMQEIYSVYSN